MRKERKVTGVELVAQLIPEERAVFTGLFIEQTLAKIRAIPDFASHDIETQQVEIGNMIYSPLHKKGFSDGQILTVRNTIFGEYRQPKG